MWGAWGRWGRGGREGEEGGEGEEERGVRRGGRGGRGARCEGGNGGNVGHLDSRHLIPTLLDNLLDSRPNFRVLLKPHNRIHLWELARKLVSVALRHAARHDDALGGALLELHRLEDLLREAGGEGRVWGAGSSRKA